MEKEPFIITISRQYGSGGREVSQLLAKKLGLPVYDRQIIDMAAEKLGVSNLSHEALAELESSVTSGMGFVPFVPFGSIGLPMSSDMFFTEVKVLYELSKRGSCIILGRCADVVLRDYPNLYSFFICADQSFRAARGKSAYSGKTFEELEKEDEKRADYYQRYTGRQWGRGDNYNLVVNTSRIGIENTVDVIVGYVQMAQTRKSGKNRMDSEKRK